MHTLGLSLMLASAALGGGKDALPAWDFEDATVGKLPADWTATQTGEGKGSVWKVLEDKTAPKGPKVLAQTSPDGPAALFNLCVADKTKIADVDFSIAFKAFPTLPTLRSAAAHPCGRPSVSVRYMTLKVWRVPKYNKPVSGLKLGGGQLVAPLVSGETSVPGTLASFAGSWVGCPFALIPFVQFSESMCFDVSRCSPVTRSSRK